MAFDQDLEPSGEYWDFSEPAAGEPAPEWRTATPEISGEYWDFAPEDPYDVEAPEYTHYNKTFFGAMGAQWQKQDYMVRLGNLGSRHLAGTLDARGEAEYETLKRKPPPEVPDAPGPMDDFIGPAFGMTRLLFGWGGIGMHAAGGAAAGAVGGAVLGAAGGPLAGVTAAGGALLGGKAGAAVGTFRLESGNAIAEFELMAEKIKSDTGEIIPQEAIVGAAVLTGAINASLEMVGLSQIAKLPGLSRLVGQLNRGGAQRMLRNSGTRHQLMELGRTYLKTAGVEGGTEMAQESVNIGTGEFVKGAYTSQDAEYFTWENAIRLAHAGQEGALAGGGLSIGFAAPGTAANIFDPAKARRKALVELEKEARAGAEAEGKDKLGQDIAATTALAEFVPEIEAQRKLEEVEREKLLDEEKEREKEREEDQKGRDVYEEARQREAERRLDSLEAEEAARREAEDVLTPPTKLSPEEAEAELTMSEAELQSLLDSERADPDDLKTARDRVIDARDAVGEAAEPKTEEETQKDNVEVQRLVDELDNMRAGVEAKPAERPRRKGKWGTHGQRSYDRPPWMVRHPVLQTLLEHYGGISSTSPGMARVREMLPGGLKRKFIKKDGLAEWDLVVDPDEGSIIGEIKERTAHEAGLDKSGLVLGEALEEAINDEVGGKPHRTAEEIAEIQDVEEYRRGIVGTLDAWGIELTDETDLTVVARQILGLEEAPAVIRPEGVGEGEVFDDRLGVSRDPIIDLSLASLPDNEFEAKRAAVYQRVDDLERRLDENPGIEERDPGFRRELIEAQDEYEAHQLEVFRRSHENASPADIASAITELGNSKHEQVKALILSDIVATRGISEKIRPSLEAYASRSPDHAEILASKLTRFAKTVSEARAAEGAPLGVEISDSVTGHEQGFGVSGHIRADRDNSLVGSLDYSEGPNSVLIKHIEVNQEEGRAGIGTALVRKLEELFPNKKIDWGYTTPEGEALRASIEPTLRAAEGAAPEITETEQPEGKPETEQPEGKPKRPKRKTKTGQPSDTAAALEPMRDGIRRGKGKYETYYVEEPSHREYVAYDDAGGTKIGTFDRLVEAQRAIVAYDAKKVAAWRKARAETESKDQGDITGQEAQEDEETFKQLTNAMWLGRLRGKEDQSYDEDVDGAMIGQIEDKFGKEAAALAKKIRLRQSAVLESQDAVAPKEPEAEPAEPRVGPAPHGLRGRRYYFETREDAEAWATANDWPTEHISGSSRGFLVRAAGPDGRYAGPEPRQRSFPAPAKPVEAEAEAEAEATISGYPVEVDPKDTTGTFDGLDVIFERGTGPRHEGKIFVVDQLDEAGNFVSHRVMFGFKNAAHARRAHKLRVTALAAEKGIHTGKIVGMTPEVFDKWRAREGATQKPVHRDTPVAEGEAAETGEILKVLASSGLTAALEIDGKVFAGATHVDALLKAIESGDVSQFEIRWGDVKEGFVDDRGRFLNRSESLSRAKEINPYMVEPLDRHFGLMSEDLLEVRTSLGGGATIAEIDSAQETGDLPMARELAHRMASESVEDARQLSGADVVNQSVINRVIKRTKLKTFDNPITKAMLLDALDNMSIALEDKAHKEALAARTAEAGAELREARFDEQTDEERAISRSTVLELVSAFGYKLRDVLTPGAGGIYQMFTPPLVRAMRHEGTGEVLQADGPLGKSRKYHMDLAADMNEKYAGVKSVPEPADPTGRRRVQEANMYRLANGDIIEEGFVLPNGRFMGRFRLEGAMQHLQNSVGAGSLRMAKFITTQEAATMIPGAMGLVGRMIPSEYDYITEENVTKAVAIVDDLMTAEELASVAWAGRVKRGWYEDSAKTIVSIFGVKDSNRFTGLLAALSPRTSVRNNALNAIRIWTAWVNAGRTTDPDAIKRIMRDNVPVRDLEKTPRKDLLAKIDRAYKEFGIEMSKSGSDAQLVARLRENLAPRQLRWVSVLPGWVDNTLRILTVKQADVAEVKLSGAKVDSFMHNLRGEVDYVTIDAWGSRLQGISPDKMAGSRQLVGSEDWVGMHRLAGNEYLAVSDLHRRAAEILTDMTGMKWTPAQVQETSWSWVKSLMEQVASKDETRDAVQIIRDTGVDPKRLADTPDFATLFTEASYLAILDNPKRPAGERDLGKKARKRAKERASTAVRRDAKRRATERKMALGIPKDRFAKHLINIATRLRENEIRKRQGKPLLRRSIMGRTSELSRYLDESPGGSLGHFATTYGWMFESSGALSQSKQLQHVVQAVVNSVRDVLPGLGRINVVETAEHLPGKYIRALGPGYKRSHAFYDTRDGSIWVVASNFADKSVNELVASVFHEGVGHAGIRKIIPNDEELNTLFDRIYKDHQDSALMSQIRDRYLSPPTSDWAPGDPLSDSDVRMLGDEYVAHVAALGDPSGILQRVIARIRKILRKAGVVKGWTDNDILGLLRESARGLSGKPLSSVEIGIDTEMTDTGELMLLTRPADVLIRQMDKRVAVLEEIRACVRA